MRERIFRLSSSNTSAPLFTHSRNACSIVRPFGEPLSCLDSSSTSFFSSSYSGRSSLSISSVILYKRSTKAGFYFSVSRASWNRNVQAWSIRYTFDSALKLVVHIKSVVSVFSSLMILAVVPRSYSSKVAFCHSLRLRGSGSCMASSYGLWKASHFA